MAVPGRIKTGLPYSSPPVSKSIPFCLQAGLPLWESLVNIGTGFGHIVRNEMAYRLLRILQSLTCGMQRQENSFHQK